MIRVGAVDAVKSVGLGLGRLWRILVCQRLEPTHNVISHSDTGEAVNLARQDDSVDSFLDCTRAEQDFRFRKLAMISLRHFVVSILPGPVHSALRPWRRRFFRFKQRVRDCLEFAERLLVVLS